MKGLHRSDIHVSDIYFDLLKGEETSCSKIARSPLQICANSPQNLNNSSVFQQRSDTLFSTKDREISSILEELRTTIRWKTAAREVG